MAEERAQWGSSLEFILTVIGYAVGLGNVWRFPYLVFANGGGAFIIIFFLMLFLVGIPMFFLELSIGQFSGLGPTHVFYKMAPIFQGLGYAALIVNAFVGFYYNVIIAYCVYYLIMSIRAKLPWSDCSPEWADCVKRDENMNCSEFNALYPDISKIRSPSEGYFYESVLQISGGIGEVGTPVWTVVLSLLGAWTIVFLALSKGVQSLGKVSYFTATFPYIVLTILVITGATLDNAGKGVEFYIGSVNATKFGEPSVWKDATTQVFFALSACSGGLIAMSSFNAFKNNILRDTLLIPILDIMTGVYAGFAIFTVLGYMAQAKCVANDNFAAVVAGGPELAFVVYPEGISLIKAVPPLWSCLFFLMMLALGFGSEFSIMETTMVMFMDLFKNALNTKWKKIATRGVICMVFFLGGLIMTTNGGFYVLSLINEYAAGYPLLVIGLLQSIVVPWVYGTKRLINDIECMIGKKPEWFWWIWWIAWRFVCPIVLLAIIIATIIIGGGEPTVNNVPFPPWAKAIGWVIVALPLSVLVGCAFAQMYIYKFNWKALFSPDEEYYANYRRNLAIENEAAAAAEDKNNDDEFEKKEKAYSQPKVEPVFRNENEDMPMRDSRNQLRNYGANEAYEDAPPEYNPDSTQL